MDALMAALVAALFATAPDRAASIVAASPRPGRAVVIALAVAIVLATAAALLGASLAPRLAPAARLLMLAAALGLVGVEFLIRPLPAAPSSGIVAATAGSGLWFVVATLAMRGALPWLAAPGAIVGTTAALAAAAITGRAWTTLPLTRIRRVVGALFLTIGATLGCIAIGIV